MKTVVICLLFIAMLWAQAPSDSATSPVHVTTFVAPAYPWKARIGRMQGDTTSEINVRAEGTVESVNVTMAHPFFRDYVQGALKQWKFEATGKTFTQKVTVRFSLVDGCDDIRSIQPDAYRETHVQAHLPQFVEVRTCPELIITNTD